MITPRFRSMDQSLPTRKLRPAVKFSCAHCGKEGDKRTSEVNRARTAGLRLFCNLKCSGLSKRKHKPKAQRIEEKRLYDLEYRRKNQLLLKAKKHEYFKQTYNPVKAAKVRKKRMPLHVAYCQQPRYRRWKREYDRQYRAKEYGPLAEAYLLTIDINREVKQRMTDHEIRKANGTINKRQARRRENPAEESRERHRTTLG